MSRQQKNKPRKTSSRSKTHPYLILKNWMPGGSCRFWDQPSFFPSIGHNHQMYSDILAEEIKLERGIVMFQENVQKNHSI